MLMIGKALSPEQRLQKGFSDILSRDDYAPVAGILMFGEHKIDDNTPTAVTNGVNVKYGRKFVSDLTDPEFRFVILHETYHVLYRHLTVYRWMFQENAQLANCATDFVINLKLVDAEKAAGRNATFLKMPPVGLLDEQYRGMDSATVYKLLKKKYGGGGSGKGQQGQPGNGAPSGGFDEHDWQTASERSDEENKEIDRAVDEAIRQGILLAGKLGSGGVRELKDLIESRVDWREALREFICTTCSGSDYSTWRRPNRRFVSMGIYMPSGITEQVGELIIAIDTSGSIGGPQLAKFLGEVKAICSAVHPSGVRILYWDTAVCADEYYTMDRVEDIIKSTKPAGGGGTTVECVPEYMKDKMLRPQAVVVLTDGYLGSSWGEWPVPVLWCILDNKTAVPSVGKTVHVSLEDM